MQVVIQQFTLVTTFFILFLRKIGKIFDFIERVRLNFDIKKGARCNENHVN